MNVVWFCATPLPGAEKVMPVNVNVGMSWLVNTAAKLKSHCKLTVIFPALKLNKISVATFEQIEYIALPYPSNKLENYCSTFEQTVFQLFEDMQIDILHIWGTEFPFEYSVVRAAERAGLLDKTCVSIQGLVSIYAEHYIGSIPPRIVKRISLGDFLRRESLLKAQNNMRIRGKYEVQLLKRVRHVIGRTQWDFACVTQINPSVKFYKCNETLRTAFYTNNWNIELCKRNTIFVSQGGYPIKGFDVLLKAAALLLKKYPQLEINVGGASALAEKNLMGSIKRRNYELYYLDLIKENNLHNKIHFLGKLTEEEMCAQYLKAHVFVLPSHIENSPNSMGEAMLLGVPSVVSYCGGIPQLFCDQKDGFMFQPGAYYMLAYYIDQIFSNDQLAKKFSANAKMHAQETHSIENNLRTLLNIYGEISGTSSCKF